MRRRGGALVVATLILAACSAGTGRSPGPAPSSVPASPSPGTPTATPAATAAPTPTATPAATAAPTPTATPAATAAPTSVVLADLRWQQLATLEGIGYPLDVAGFAGGYVLVAEGGVRFSRDGRTWRKVTLPGRATSVALPEALAAAGSGRTILIVGRETYEPCTGDWGPSDSTGSGGPVCRMSPIAWRSTDGVTWRRSAAWPTPAVATDAYRGLDSSAWPAPTGGWDAALTYVTGDEAHLVGVFHSDDGRAWTALEPNLPAGIRGDHTTLNWGPGAADRTGRRIVVQIDSDEGVEWEIGRLYSAAVGKTWKTVAGPPGNPSVASIVAQSSGSVRWFAGGTRHTSDGSSQPAVWMTRDLATWSTRVLPLGEAAGGSLTDLVETWWGYAAVGDAWGEPDGASRQAVAWASADGARWTRVGVPTNSGPASTGILADGPLGVLGVGFFEDEESGDVSIVVSLLR